MTCRSGWVTGDTGPPDDPTIVVGSGPYGATGFETSDREIRCVDPDDPLSVVRSLERETVMPHTIIRGKCLAAIFGGDAEATHG
jgi:hypothetical protein